MGSVRSTTLPTLPSFRIPVPPPRPCKGLFPELESGVFILPRQLLTAPSIIHWKTSKQGILSVLFCPISEQHTDHSTETAMRYRAYIFSWRHDLCAARDALQLFRTKTIASRRPTPRGGQPTPRGVNVCLPRRSETYAGFFKKARGSGNKMDIPLFQGYF